MSQPKPVHSLTHYAVYFYSITTLLLHYIATLHLQWILVQYHYTSTDSCGTKIHVHTLTLKLLIYYITSPCLLGLYITYT